MANMNLRAVQAAVSETTGCKIKYCCAGCERFTVNPIADLDAKPGTYYCADCADTLLNGPRQ